MAPTPAPGHELENLHLDLQGGFYSSLPKYSRDSRSKRDFGVLHAAPVENCHARPHARLCWLMSRVPNGVYMIDTCGRERHAVERTESSPCLCFGLLESDGGKDSGRKTEPERRKRCRYRRSSMRV